MEKQTIFSGIQPSGKLTLGNYLGAVRNWGKLQDEYNCFYCIVDMHAMTQYQVPKDLRKQTLEGLAMLLACGLDPEKNTLFIQSHVPAHAEAAWLMSCMTYFGELSRMTQFKDKSAKQSDNINAGLFTYPVLMACDILLYQADLVPVGSDQKQHIELTRDVAERFNNRYSPTFAMPKPYIPKVGAKIMSLQEPEKKMSKSDENDNANIYLLDPPEVIKKKFKRAVTDSVGVVQLADDQPGIKNLITIYSVCKNMTMDQVVEEFEGQGYGVFKDAVADAVIEVLKPVQDKFHELMANKAYLEEVYKDGADRAERTARKTLRKMYKKVGFIPR
ncbi:tryptophan--tRNA ligase [Acidaminobacter sp. JC074]|uniref:tryptophan--tRNA ligase n=1 Tax=Acidaminobacter sp. JC074 TaxID=2530199 RepID=UPI001F0F32CE|nr:tryptophan--tRNA ligase [Acidaminobacter sp. JC074]MCH4890596.1 tryptophan--tRNA ligase [Acidaminobacter sp. JC074]